jgi:hypothetical protein
MFEVPRVKLVNGLLRTKESPTSLPTAAKLYDSRAARDNSFMQGGSAEGRWGTSWKFHGLTLEKNEVSNFGRMNDPAESFRLSRASKLRDVVSVEARSRHILASMVAFRNGDFSVRLPLNWQGIDVANCGRFQSGRGPTLARAGRAVADYASASMGCYGCSSDFLHNRQDNR